MLSDIEIAQAAKMEPIQEIAASVGIGAEQLEFYGKYKAKISSELIDRVSGNPDGKLVLVTAINPTPAGEGKTTTTVGLGDAMRRLQPGGADGGYQLAFHRRYACDYRGEQPAVGDD